MKRWIIFAATLAAATAGALPEQNLIPNADFSDKTNPLKGWRVAYPHQQQQYSDNEKYVRVTDQAGKRCVEFAVPAGRADAGGAMIETAFIKCEPGAIYKAEVECCPKDMTMIVFIEAWVPLAESIVMKPGLRVWPAEDGKPRLMMCGRKQAQRSGSKSWITISDTYTVPKTVTLAGKETPPEYISVKAYVYGGGGATRKSYVANFRLTKVK
jgi:hypothetical protein